MAHIQPLITCFVLLQINVHIKVSSFWYRCMDDHVVDLRVSEFGAVGNGIDDDTEAFEAAIRQIGEHGGGRLLVTGTSSMDQEVVYSIRPINLTNHMELYIEAGARILGNVSSWPIIPGLPSYGQGRNHIGPRHTSLLHGEHLINVTIRGQDFNRSMIDGNGEFWWTQYRGGTENVTRGSLVEFLYSTDIRLYDITLMNSPFWTVHPYDCDNVHIRNVHVRSPLHTPNTDGFDPDSSRDVRIEDSTFIGGDDCISIKSGWDCFGIEYGKPASHIYIRNMTCYSSTISLGSEHSGGIEHVLGEQIYFPSMANQGVKVKSGEMRGGYMRNVTFRDVHFTGSLSNSAIYIDMNLYSHAKGLNPSCPTDWKPPHLPIVEDFLYENWHGETVNFTAKTMFFLHGIDSSPIRNVRIQEVYFPPGIWNCSNLSNVTTQDGTISPWPPCDDVQVVTGALPHTPTPTVAVKPGNTKTLATDPGFWGIAEAWIDFVAVLLIVIFFARTFPRR